MFLNITLFYPEMEDSQEKSGYSERDSWLNRGI